MQHISAHTDVANGLATVSSEHQSRNLYCDESTDWITCVPNLAAVSHDSDVFTPKSDLGLQVDIIGRT